MNGSKNVMQTVSFPDIKKVGIFALCSDMRKTYRRWAFRRSVAQSMQEIAEGRATPLDLEEMKKW